MTWKGMIVPTYVHMHALNLYEDETISNHKIDK
jgi:hypothetical protein